MPNPAKIHPDLARRLETGGISAPEVTTQPTYRVIVKYRDGAMRATESVAGVLETHHSFTLIPASAHTLTLDAIYQLSDRDGVEIIWHDDPGHTMLDVS